MANRKHLLCEGTGYYPVGSQTIDEICSGTGVVPIKVCPICEGTKFYPISSEEPCYACDGSGVKLNSPFRLGEDHYYAHEILGCINDAEYTALNDVKKDGVRIILSLGIVDMGENAVCRTKLFNFFPEGTTTRINLLELLGE